MRERVRIYVKQFEYYKSLAERSIAQIDEEYVFHKINPTSNSIAIIMKHIAGNQLSRWTNIFEEDGEKSWRNRDQEFQDDFDGYSALFAYWEKGWQTLYSTLNDITDDDLDKIIYIRNMGCTVHDAILRQLSHYPYHIGQIVFIAKIHKGELFESLSIPLDQSEAYNAKRFDAAQSLIHFTDDLR